MRPHMYCQGTPLDKTLLAVFMIAVVRPLVGVDAVVPAEIGFAVEGLGMIVSIFRTSGWLRSCLNVHEPQAEPNRYLIAAWPSAIKVASTAGCHGRCRTNVCRGV